MTAQASFFYSTPSAIQPTQRTIEVLHVRPGSRCAHQRRQLGFDLRDVGGAARVPDIEQLAHEFRDERDTLLFRYFAQVGESVTDSGGSSTGRANGRMRPTVVSSLIGNLLDHLAYTIDVSMIRVCKPRPHIFIQGSTQLRRTWRENAMEVQLHPTTCRELIGDVPLMRRVHHDLARREHRRHSVGTACEEWQYAPATAEPLNPPRHHDAASGRAVRLIRVEWNGYLNLRMVDHDRHMTGSIRQL
jgi:hypothetical protein